MYVLQFSNGEYLHNVVDQPFHYTRTTERLDARVYQHSSAALVDAGLIWDEVGHEPQVVAAPMAYEIRRNSDGTFAINCDARTIDRLAIALGFMKSGISVNTGDDEYDDFSALVQNFYRANTFLDTGHTITANGQS